ncbi:GerW family sporulation protein [Caldicoprobacter faecalis]|uniref:Sporulation protein YtfJ n=1 Tax=Caldicoprobacter faecalis TaxID=937334 RepID=A0A1I5UAI7_9FIRM|nr:GerW family sporulation protein [Caldicoprobacter faecalis]SFP91967.1 sporulation protein YtfJ [Caldicoprobacter faecalis]
MSGHPIENIMKTTMENIKEMIDVNTIVGDAVETADGNVIIPISKVSFGFVAGGGEYKDGGKEQKQGRGGGEGEPSASIPFAGGTGAGVSVNPVAFLVVGGGKVKLLPVCFRTSADRIIEMIPQLLEDIQNLVGPKKENAQNTPTQQNVQ